MNANELFRNQPKSFWANVRSISQAVGYTQTGTGQIKIPTFDEMRKAMQILGLDSKHIITSRNKPTVTGELLSAYFTFRAKVLYEYVRPRLMNAKQAAKTFKGLQKRLCPTCPLPMNKQTGEKKANAYFTGIINMLIESNADSMPCDYDPRVLTSITKGGKPVRTLARRVDGAFPSAANPIAVWEIKEYYYTTTFGSRIADGVYETLLDGMELEELREHEKIDVKHYLMVDDYNTWWNMGRSYLCRIIDTLHMGYLDEALFGSEVTERLPQLVREWVKLENARRNPSLFNI